jgi:hypothetical protein
MPRFAAGPSTLVLLCGLGCAAGALPAKQPAPAVREAAQPAPDQLEFSEFFEPGAGLRPSAKLRSLAGKRVRLVGFMAQLELPPTGAFYLVPRPLHCDESGGGTADLPPESVLVLSAASTGKVLPFLEGALQLTGTFELGNAPDSEGRVAAFRLRLDAS